MGPMEQWPMEQWPMDFEGFRVLAEDACLLFVEKAPGVSFHRKEGEGSSSFIETVRRATGRSDLHPVHRLDEVTSGLMVFAKGPRVAGEMGALFSTGRIEKYYLAVAFGRPRKTMGKVQGDLVRSRRGQWRLSRTMENPSVTQFISAPLGHGKRVYLLHPRTGKTHQLRVVMKSLGVPIQGDPLYGPAGDHGRCLLHAWAMHLTLDGKTHAVVTDPPFPELEAGTGNEVLKGWNPPWNRTWPGEKWKSGDRKENPGLAEGTHPNGPDESMGLPEAPGRS